MALISPNELLELGKRYMLHGQDPVTRDDRERLMHYWARLSDAPLPTCRLMNLLFDFQIPDDEIRAIVLFQQNQKVALHN